jgi:hypothetical protein
MTIEQFSQGILEFNEGEATFSRGMTISSFLYKCNWYPIRAFVCQVEGNPNITTDISIRVITSLLPYTRIKENVDFTNSNGFPIPLNENERLVELSLLKVHLNNLIDG